MPTENTSQEYVAVRMQVVRVKKRFLGYKDTILGSTTVIPDTVEQAIHLGKKIKKLMSQYGLEFEVS